LFSLCRDCYSDACVLTKCKGDGIVAKQLSWILLGLGFLFGCSMVAPGTRASSELKDKDGKTVGRAVFREGPDGVLVRVDVKGLTPGLHGVHVHGVGKCEGPAFASAGGHFNPTQRKHGFKSPEGAHAGDLPNMLVAKDGVGRFEALTDSITLKTGPNSLLDNDGSALVIHASADDYSTDPAGNSGDRIACGVIVSD
jgi:superoxide dismutase, Cu-Zn family